MRSIKFSGMTVAVALLAAGCGGGGGGGAPMGGSSSGPYAPPFQPPCEVLDGRTVVDIRENEFVCNDQGEEKVELTVPAETQIVWTNSDEVEHSVTKQKGPGSDFNSGPLQPGSTFSQVLDETGEYTIVDEESKASEPAEMTIIVEEEEETEPAPGGQPGATP